MKQGERRIYHVTELTRLIKGALESEFGNVWIEGELSNVRRPSSGHCYFTIKDSSAQISAVMFRGNQSALKFSPADGVLVQAYGQISVYEQRGSYQIIVRQMEEAGKGSLQAAFEALKNKLHKEGLFDESRKRPLPLLPQHIGVVTSPTGAAIRDILNVISRRFPNVHVVLAPAKVQGDGAAEEVAASIEQLNKLGGLDVLIVGRGGGSLEDLWCFNEEVVARAIAASDVPVISAVGHEIDFTISDFVADLRSPTPSAAAEQVVGLKEHLEKRLDDGGRRLARALQESLLRAKARLNAASASYVFAEPKNLVRQYRQRVGESAFRVENSLKAGLRESQQRLDDAGLRASHEMCRATERGREDLKRLGVQLRALSPHGVLSRGYSITRDSRGNVVRSVADVEVGQSVRTTLSDGELDADITGTTPGS